MSSLEIYAKHTNKITKKQTIKKAMIIECSQKEKTHNKTRREEKMGCWVNARR